ncbi:MAG: hypothetical protein U9Q62_02330 [Campylobacterota bacterium]|nr:hypothetical protein [Campylobacterota bacterium]
MKLLTSSILSIALTASFFSGCSTLDPKPAAELQTDPSLPVVSINGNIADMHAIAFEWKSIDDQRVNGIYIYRGEPAAEDPKLSRIAIIDNRFSTHYSDETVKPDTRYQYRFTTFSDELTQSKGSKTHTVNTLPVLTSVSFFRSIGNLPRRAKLIWRPHTNLSVKYYVLERRDGNDGEWQEIQTLQGRLNAEFIDTDLDDNALYYYRLRVRTFDDVLSTPSDQVKVITKPLPATVKDLRATRNQAKQISIRWEASQEADFDHYRLYRSESEDGSYDYHVKLTKTEFIDKVSEDGQVYFYKVTAVDKDGLESLLDNIPTMGSSLIKLTKPDMVKASFKDNIYRLSWSRGDQRTVSYVVIKTIRTSWVTSEIEEITDIRETHFNDLNIAAGTSYEYQVVAVDKHGIRSEPTEAKPFSFQAK